MKLPNATVTFTTRRGGVSTGPYASLNLGRWTEDRPQDVERNRELLAEAIEMNLAYGRQVHGPRVRRVTNAAEQIEEADGQATGLGGVAPMVLVADCLPIALARRYLDGADIILVEGFSAHPLPKIEVFRTTCGDQPIYDASKPNADEWVAIVTDHPAFRAPFPVFRFSDTSWLVALANYAWDRARILPP